MRLCHQDGNATLDHLAQPAVRYDRAAANLRTDVPGGGHGFLRQPRQGQTDLPVGRGHRDCVCHVEWAYLNDRFWIDAPFAFDAGLGIKGLRQGHLPATFGEGAAPTGHAALDGARRLRVGVVEVRLPDLLHDALLNILHAQAAAIFEDLTLSGLDDPLTWQGDEDWPNTLRKARCLSEADHDRLRYLVMQVLDRLFSAVDVLIGPVMTGPMLIACNDTGHPCLHLRAGFEDLSTRSHASLGSGKRTTGAADATGQKSHVPLGISLWGRVFEEGPMLNLGMALELALAVATLHPDFPV